MVGDEFLQIGGGSMPILDFANPLHNFTSGNLSYTATQDCYVCGSLVTNGGTLKIDGTDVALASNNAAAGMSFPYVQIKLKAGQVVATTAVENYMHVFAEI